MKAQVWIALVALFLAVLATGPVVSGCGGGSGGGGNPPPITRWAVEATKGGSVIDPTNIVAGETVQFVVAGYTDTNQRYVLAASDWSVDANGQSEGSMSSGGQFTATTAGPQFNVFATQGGTQRIGVAQVKAANQALVTGRVLNNSTSQPVSAVRVDFYDAGNNLVGTAYTQGNGTFRAVVPASATTFDVNKNAFPIGYYKQFLYKGLWFLPKPSSCSAPLPALSNGTTTALQGDIRIPPTYVNGSSQPPPPPPSPCG